MDIIPYKDAINATNLCFDATSGILYFSSGATIFSISVDISQFDDMDTTTLTDTSKTTHHHHHSDSNNDNGITMTIECSPSLRSMTQLAPMPPYMSYPHLFDYFVNQLFYPSGIIATLIARLHNDGVLKQCCSQEDEIEALSHILESNERDALRHGEWKSEASAMANEIDRTQQKKIYFAIHVHPPATADSVNTAIPVYTKTELSMDFETRTEIFYDRIRSKDTSAQPTVVLVRRDHLVLDACKHFSVLKDLDLRKPMFIFFAGEEGLDMGGVTREFYQLLSTRILDPNAALFYCIETNNTYHPNPASRINPTHLMYFRFIGKLLGKALLDSQLMDLRFTRVVFKAIIGQPIVYDDLQHVDPSMYLSMQRILKCDDVQLMDLSFCAEINDFGSGNVVPLLVDGKEVHPDTDVTEENKHHFVEAYSRWKLYDGIQNQLRHLIAGIYEVIPREFFAIFNDHELEMLLCGKRDIDTTQWKQSTSYEGGFTSESPTVTMFWDLVEEMGQVQRAKLLQFVTGTSCLPSDGFQGLHPRFTICRWRHGAEELLPISHTCINRIDLMEYFEKDLLRRHLHIVLDVGLVGFANH